MTGEQFASSKPLTSSVCRFLQFPSIMIYVLYSVLNCCYYECTVYDIYHVLLKRFCCYVLLCRIVSLLSAPCMKLPYRT